MQGFAQQGDTISYLSFNEDSLLSTLPARVYIMKYEKFRGFYLEIDVNKYMLPTIFGKGNTRIERIFNAFNSRQNSTGVLLTGHKGAGKTLFTKLAANKAINDGIPVIIINQAFSGDDFNQLVNAIGKCVLIFDEVAKTYGKTNSDDESISVGQQSLLSFLDGLGSNAQRLMFFTENEEYHIDNLLINRPGRILFHYKFRKLPEDEINEMCAANSISEAITAEIVELSRFIPEFTYDMLSAIIEEHKRNADLHITELVTDMNINYIGKTNTEFQYYVEQMLVDDKPWNIKGDRVVKVNGRVACWQNRNNPEDTDYEKCRSDEKANVDHNSLFLHDDAIFYDAVNYTVFKYGSLTVIARKIPLDPLPDMKHIL